MASIYESGIFQSVPDRSMHPGGLRLTDRAVRLAGLTGGMRCADLGCGAGASCAYLTNQYRLAMTGFDHSEALIAAARQAHPGLKFECQDCRTLPLADGSLDAILMECTLSVIGNAAEVLSGCSRVLKSAGKFIVSDITLKQQATVPADSLYTAEQLTALLRNTGFSVEICEDHLPALRTYAAELSAASDNDAALLLQCICTAGLRLRDLGYHLFIAEKCPMTST